MPLVGPIITALGVASGDGQVRSPNGMSPDGFPIYDRPLPIGFLIYAEARPGASNRPVGRSTFNWSAGNPNLLPDFQIWASNDLGTPTAAVCDDQLPLLGGVPKLEQPQFGTQQTANIINDFSCRFDTRTASDLACTRGRFEPFAFANSTSRIQFCTRTGVGAEIAFPRGSTKVTVRVLDSLGQPGPPASMIIRVP
jgi:hypothetical protein